MVIKRVERKKVIKDLGLPARPSIWSHDRSVSSEEAFGVIQLRPPNPVAWVAWAQAGLTLRMMGPIDRDEGK